MATLEEQLPGKVVIVGAGVMGSSIAQVFAMSGVSVTLVDVDQPALDRALGLVESGLVTFADAGKLPRDRIVQVLGLITPSLDLVAAAQNADFVVEAVPEVPDLKRDVFARLNKTCKPEAVIASNTSALDVFKLAELDHPERLVIAHFFAPAHIIPLVEVVPGPETSARTVATTVALLERLGKDPVVMKKFGPGFIVNRIQRAIGETALEMIEEGLVAPDELDRAIKLSLGVRLPVVGVVQTFDFQGLDMLLQYQRNVGKVYDFIEEKVNEGALGAKTSKGIYDYQGRSEAEILNKRDLLYLKMLDYLREIDAFGPV